MTDEATPPTPPEPAPAPAPAPDAAPTASPTAVTAPDAPIAPAAATAWKPNYVFLAVVSILSLAADLGSKGWAVARLADAKFGERRIDVIPHYFGFIFAENRGGAWGLLQDQPETIRRPFFLVISVVAIVFIVSLYRKLTQPQLALRWGLPLVLGGALGNLINRIQYNHVVDFIDVQMRWGGREHHWPTFNIADIAIVAGVGLMAVDMFTSRRAPLPPLPAASAPPAHELAAPFGVDAPLPADAPAPPAPSAAPKET